MGLVHPLLAAGALLAVVPLIIHLFNRRRHKPLDWAAMRFARAAWKKIRRRTRFENLLLLLLRMAAVALLALALARPFTAGSSPLAGLTEEHQDLVLLVDGSASMGYRPGLESVWDRALERAAELVEDLDAGSGDRVNLYLVGDHPRLVSDRAPTEALAMLATLEEPLDEGFDLAAALTRVLEDLDAAAELGTATRRLVLVTDALTPGTHVVQIGKGETVEERRDVVILAGQGAMLDLGRAEVPVEPPKPSGADLDVGLSLWGAAGFGLAAGEAFDIDGQVEPATKLAVPLEAGAVLELGPAWLRIQGGWAPLLGGSLLYLSGDEVKGAPGFIQVGGAAGASFAGFQAGALGALTVPSRTSLRGLVGRDIVGPMGVELRGGVNLHPARSAEPAVELLVRVQPSLF